MAGESVELKTMKGEYHIPLNGSVLLGKNDS